MEIIHDRRSGFDRRHRFLNGLDRRMSPPPPFASAEVLDDALGIASMRDTQSVDHVRTAAYWGRAEDVPPVE